MQRSIKFTYQVTLLAFVLVGISLASCTRAILIHSAGSNPAGNQTLVDKKSNTVISVGNDQNGILINIRIPDAFDQYKVLKYGGYLALSLPSNHSKAYIISYPISNEDKSLKIPINIKKSSDIPMDSLLVNLSREAGTMKIFNFYNQHLLSLPSKLRDSVAVDVYHEPSEKGALVYSAYIPYNSISGMKSFQFDKSKIRISFTSGALKVNHFYGGGPAFAPSFSYSVPRTAEQKRLGIHPPNPDPQIVQKLAEPVSFDADLTLTVK